MTRRNAAVLGLLVAQPILAQAEVAAQMPPPPRVAAFGPLTFEEGGPLQRISYTPRTERAATLEPGMLSADVWLGFSNIFEQDSANTYELFLDMERLLSTTTLRYGLIEGLEVGGRLTFETNGGGVLDDVRLFAKWEALTSADHASLMSLRIVTRIPTQQDVTGRAHADFALQALGQISFETWYLHGMLGASVCGSARRW